MKFIESIDPFVMQLLIVPLIVIGLGIVISIILKNVFVAPIVTLLMNLGYETWYMKYYYPTHEITYTSWNLIYPATSFLVSCFVLYYWRLLNKLPKESFYLPGTFLLLLKPNNLYLHSPPVTLIFGVKALQ